jgi:hypothetical protein
VCSAWSRDAGVAWSQRSVAPKAQAANAIGSFYGKFEHPNIDQHDTYSQYYTLGDLQIFASYVDNAVSSSADAAYTANQRMVDVYSKISREPYPHWAPYYQALDLYNQNIEMHQKPLNVSSKASEDYKNALRAHEERNGGGA